MRVLIVILIAAVIGGAVGGAVAYVEIRANEDAISALAGELGSRPPVDPGRKASRVKVDQPNYNFGKMERGREKSHEFLIRNIGTAPLRLKVGQTSCKCTLGEVSGDSIAPGESTHVRLEWSAKSDRGPFRQSATIHTNDPLQPDIELTIEGEILDATGIEPTEFVFDKVPIGETKSAEVYVMAMLQDDLEIGAAEMSEAETRDYFDVKIEPADREKLPDSSARDGVRITVTVKPGLPVGRFSQYLTLTTNFEEGEKLHIPVIGSVYGDISIHGADWREEEGVLVIGQVKGSEGKKSRVNLVVRGKGAGDVKFELATVDPPELKVSIGEPHQIRETLLHVPVELEVPPGTRPMARLATPHGDEAKVLLKTSHPQMKELVMRVRFAVDR